MRTTRHPVPPPGILSRLGKTRRVLLLGLAIAVLTFIGPTAEANDRELGPDGIVHSISVENRTGGGTRIVHQMQKADGSVTSLIIPGTDDPIPDVDPAISICPSTNLPVAVWSRLTGADYEIQASFFDGTRWSSPRALTSNGWDDRAPLVVCGKSGYVHVMWTSTILSDGTPSFYETIIDTTGGTYVQPTLIQLPSSSAAVTDANGSTPTLNPTDILFSFDSSPRLGQRRVVAFGGSDEPIPVCRRADFVMSTSVNAIDHAKIENVGPRIVVLVRPSNTAKLYYAVETSNAWTPLRQIDLDSISEERAEVLIKRMAGHDPPQ